MDLNLAIHPLNPTKVKLESKKTSPAFPRACQTKTLGHQGVSSIGPDQESCV
jgi:hypothetical protein